MEGAATTSLASSTSWNANCQLPLTPRCGCPRVLERCPNLSMPNGASIAASLFLAAQHPHQLADKCPALDNGPLRFAVDNAIQGEPGQPVVDDGIEATPADGFPGIWTNKPS